MKLFNDVSEEKKDNPQQERIEGKISLYRVAILSQNEERIARIKSILVLYNILRIQVFSVDITDDKKPTSLDEFDVVLIDIGNIEDVEFIHHYLFQSVPINSMVYVIGNSDSISFANALEKYGIQYLAGDVQLDDLPMLLWHGQNEIKKRQGNIITFLGCKGGVGTSQLAIQIVQTIHQQTKLPILYVQGASGSADLDFILETPLDKDGTTNQLSDNLNIRIEAANNAWHFDDESTYQFNLVVFDHNVNNSLSASHLTNVFNSSNTIIVVINRDAYSIKMAKTIIEERSRLIARQANIADKRFMICVNDNKPFTKNNMLTNAEIEEFIEHPIEFKRSYISSNKKLKLAVNSKEIKEIAALLIGADKNKIKSLPSSGEAPKKKRSLFKRKQ